jgi:hypothetical protein
MSESTLTPIEQRLMANVPVSFHESLYDACMHGELTIEMAVDWFEGEDQALALKIIRSGTFIQRSPEMRAYLDRCAEETP